MKTNLAAFKNLKPYFGDIHNHCNVSYGHGALSDAFTNARLQLDFASVTGHSSWPDIPNRSGIMESVVDYHVAGFKKLDSLWDYFVHTTEEFNDPGRFITFLSYEIHSMQDGDYTAVFRRPDGKMFKPPTVQSFRDYVVAENLKGNKCFLLPHHIAYKTGYRGINWDSYREDASPLVEIVSMHGCSESDDAPFPYLHTMGPRHGGNTMQAGLARGYHFGVTGSTDHHSAHPGSYGFGKTGVWAKSLSREDIWEALENRRTYAVSGDRISLALSVDDAPLGSRIPSSARKKRHIEAFVEGGYALDYVEILKNNRVLIRRDIFPAKPDPVSRLHGKVHIEVGWGEKSVEQTWTVSLSVKAGTLIDTEPRFHGVDIVDPKDKNTSGYHFSEMTKMPDGVEFRTKTWGNPTATSHAAQGVSLEIEGSPETVIHAEVNGKIFEHSLQDLLRGAVSEYLGGFLTGAVCFHRFIPRQDYTMAIEFDDGPDSIASGDFYYLRVAQKNGQWGWSSPVRYD